MRCKTLDFYNLSFRFFASTDADIIVL